MRRDKDNFTAPNQKRGGITLTYTNLSGERPHMVEMNRRVAIIRTALLTAPNMQPVDVVLGFKAVGISVTLNTATKYLARARGEWVRPGR